jgi:hypothetical protein
VAELPPGVHLLAGRPGEAERAKYQRLAPDVVVPLPAPGSVVEACEDCGVEVWIGPNQQRARQAIRVHVVCYGCSFWYVDEAGGLDGLDIIGLSGAD